VAWLVEMQFNEISSNPEMVELVSKTVPLKEIRDLYRQIRKSMLLTLTENINVTKLWMDHLVNKQDSPFTFKECLMRNLKPYSKTFDISEIIKTVM
jgi:hypothetical protein